MHVNASLAKQLQEWDSTKVDRHDILTESRRKGFVCPIDGVDQLTQKGRDFIVKWAGPKPENAYLKKPREISNAPEARFENRNRRY
jgi:hypothetical protein